MVETLLMDLFAFFQKFEKKNTLGPHCLVH